MSDIQNGELSKATILLLDKLPEEDSERKRHKLNMIRISELAALGHSTDGDAQKIVDAAMYCEARGVTA